MQATIKSLFSRYGVNRFKKNNNAVAFDSLIYLLLMMAWTNFHTHSNFCDAIGEPEEYIQYAVRNGIKILGFSSHAPMSFPVYGMMKKDRLPEYCRKLRELREQYKSQIDIFTGLEIDYIPGETGPDLELFNTICLDYKIGSVHFIGYQDETMPWQLDGTQEQFKWGMDNLFDGSIRKLVEKYYSLIREMVKREPPDVIGHLDLIKKNNPGGLFYSENEHWYQDAIEETLEVISQSGCIIEVNTGGLARKRTDSLYPSGWIIRRCYELSIPITINADAHKPDMVAACFPTAAKTLYGIGFRELSILADDGWKPCPFSEKGLELSLINKR